MARMRSLCGKRTGAAAGGWSWSGVTASGAVTIWSDAAALMAKRVNGRAGLVNVEAHLRRSRPHGIATAKRMDR